MGEKIRHSKHGVEIVHVMNGMLSRWKRDRGFDLDALSGFLHRSAAWLYKVLECGLHMHAESIAPLTRATGDTALIDLICRECGGTFVAAPNVKPLSEADIRRVMSETHHVVDAYLGALENDRAIDEVEARRVLVECDEAIQALHEFRAVVAANAHLPRVKRGLAL